MPVSNNKQIQRYYRQQYDHKRKEEEAPGGGGDDATDEAHAPGAGEGAAGEERGEGEWSRTERE